MTCADLYNDHSRRFQVTLTIWGTEAEEFNAQDNSVIAIKGARIGEFNNGKNLSTLSSSLIQLDPDIPEAHRYCQTNTDKMTYNNNTTLK